MEELKLKISEDVYDRLNKANLDSISSILTSNEKELQQATGLDLITIQYVVKQAANIFLKNKSIQPASQIPEWTRLSTGCQTIDSITNGGIPLNGVTEIVGCSGVGKTQFCLQLTLMSQLQEGQFLKKNQTGVVYICTEDVFPSKRLNQLAKHFRSKYKTTTPFEDNIYIEHIANYAQLRRLLFIKLQKLLEVKAIRLIVIDSIAGLFRSDNDQTNYLNRSQDFVALTRKLHEISDTHGAAIICTNQVTDNIDTGTVEPCLGLMWSNLVQNRFNIVRFNDSVIRTFEIVFSPDLPDRNCQFIIHETGLLPVK